MGAGVVGVLFALLINFIQAQVSPITNQGWYTVVGSKSLRPNWDYHCAVTVSSTYPPRPTTVVVEISGRQDSGEVFKTSQFTAVEPFVTRIVRLQIGELGPGEYNLTARGEGGLQFFNSTPLVYQAKSLSIFVQTDRAVYKPGSKVQFRVLVLDANLKPTVTGAIEVFVTDGDGNRVKEWRRVLTTKGVWSGEIELSDSPVLGDWTLHVAALDQTVTKKFQVAEYVLPKFEVTLNVPQHALFRDSKIAADIRAKYTYGRPVKGEATVTMQPTYFSESIQPIFSNPIRKVVPIDGKAIAEFDIVRELNLTDDYERSIKFEVTVEEALTGRRQNTSVLMTLHEHKYHMELVKTSDFFKPGLKHVVFLKVTQFDGTPVIDSNLPVKVKSGYSNNYEAYEETDHEISPTGLIKLTFYPPKNTSVIGVEASYGGVTEWFTSVSAALSPSSNYIQASITTEHPKVNTDVEIEINITEHTPSIIYQVVGRGDVLLANTVSVRNGATTAAFRFLATASMAPKAKLIVYYLRNDGELVADTVDIEIDAVLQNFVSVNSNFNEVGPGQGVELKLQAKPNSYIGLLGVDQSVLLLKKGNDLLMEDVVNELESYDNNELKAIGSWHGAFTARKAFEDAGAVVLTNGFVFESTPWRLTEWSRKAENRPLRLGGAQNVDRWIKPDLGRPVPVTRGTRPPLAGPYAFSRIPRPSWRHPRFFLPKPLPHFTWLFSNLTTDYDGRASLRKTLPDTITSWVISAFSVDSLFGLGIMDVPRKIKVFRPFFISLDLPYSIIRGEMVTIPVVVFNYMEKEVTADITLENTAGQFEFGDYSNEISDAPKVDFYRRKKVTVKPNSGESTSFMITATELGFINIKVTAKSSLAGDAVERKLLVKPEGETVFKNQAIFVDLRTMDSMKENFTLNIPKNFVDGSARIEVSAVGDILGTSLPNLERLIRMPFGCGEQNMLNFVPNIVVLDYLKNSRQLTQAIEGKCMKYMETGYQRELTYRHKDGSFSAFGTSDPSGSTWLTAFVLKSFSSAEPYMNIESRVIEEGLAWLARQQAFNGSFPEVGTVSHKDMQGGSGQGLALTSFALLPFLAYRKPEHARTIEKGISYIVSEIDNIRNDSYALAISTYVLHLANHPAKETAFHLLESSAKTSRESSMKWWKRMPKKSDTDNPHAMSPNSVDVEMTAYAMLTYIERGLVEDCMPVMSWLLSQQNSEGGFASTQDTVVALTALSKLAERIADKNPDITVTFSYGKGFSNDIRINSQNTMILQKLQIPGKVRELNITASGRGFAIVQVSYSYNVNVTGAWPMFNLDPIISKNSDANKLQLNICSSFVTGIEEEDDESSNMVVMEVTLPSGYTVDQDSLPSLQASQNVKRVELKEADTHVVLYFDKMTREELCPTVSAFRTHKVAKQKPVPVTLYDYYDQSRRARAFYSPLIATELDICEGDDCKFFKGKAGQTEARGDGGGAAAISCNAAIVITILPIIYTLTR